jgi:hypothetical protein
VSEIAEKETTDLTNYDPDQGALNIVMLDAAAKLAEKIKDYTALGKALRNKLQEEADFAAHYRGRFPHGVRYDRGVVSGPEFCRSHGFSDRTVQRWGEKLIDREEGIEIEFEARLPNAAKLVLMEQAANFSSESNEWYTPAGYLELVREVFGHIDLDPASSPLANESVQAHQIYTEADDGLSQDWFGNVFCNPPYGIQEGQSLAGMFCQKAISEYEHDRISGAILLVNSVHSQKWQAPLYRFPVCFVDHRIQFVNGDGTENKNPTFQNIFVYLGPDREVFARVFSEIGYVMQLVPHV